jgi:hypothetical protein
MSGSGLRRLARNDVPDGGSHEPEHVSHDLGDRRRAFRIGLRAGARTYVLDLRVASSPASLLGFRLFGSALIAIGVMTWFLKDSADWQAIKALLLSVAIGNVIGFLLVLFATINGTLGAMGWSAVLIYLLLLIGEGYFLSRGPASTLERRRY